MKRLGLKSLVSQSLPYLVFARENRAERTTYVSSGRVMREGADKDTGKWGMFGSLAGPCRFGSYPTPASLARSPLPALQHTSTTFPISDETLSVLNSYKIEIADCSLCSVSPVLHRACEAGSRMPIPWVVPYAMHSPQSQV